jgi:hypothetical protein
MSHAFNNGRPNLVASNVIENRKSKAIYDTLVTESSSGTNYDGHVIFSSQVGSNYRSYELYQNATLGYNLCRDCSDCTLTELRPEIDTARGPISGIDLSDVSDNIAVVDPSGFNDPDGNWLIDASNTLIATECNENVYIDRPVVELSGVTKGNNKDYNYLFCYDFPSNVNFSPG